MTRKTSRVHKPTRKAQESAAQARTTSPTTTMPARSNTGEGTDATTVPPPLRPDDMTIEELIEHIDAPMREFLEEAAHSEGPSPTAWEQHAILRDQAEAEERSDCKAEPTGPILEMKGINYKTIEGDEEVQDEEGTIQELLSPPTPNPSTQHCYRKYSCGYS